MPRHNNFLDQPDVDTAVEIELFSFLSIITPDDSEEDDEEQCPHCGSTDIWHNASGELQCDNCGYEETE